jgi:hypothetical protein
MPEVTSAVDHVPAWVAEALGELPVGPAASQTLVELSDRTVCVNAVGAPDADAAWSSYSTAAADRVEAIGERLAPVVASGRLDDRLYIAYDVTGMLTLAAYRERIGGTRPESLQLLWSLARALDAAARAGLRLTEITPASVFVHHERGVLLADLGLARQALGNPPPELDTAAGWVAPEVLLGEQATARSAVYAFGALTYFVLTGAAPYTGGPEDVLAAPPPSAALASPAVPAALDLVISAAMARDPDRRYRSASEARKLADVILQEPLAPLPAPAPRRAARVAAPRRGARVPAPRRAARAPSPRRETRAPSPPREARAPSPAPRRTVTPALGLTALALALVLAIGALAGVLLSSLGEDGAPEPRRVAAGELALLVPGGWTGAGTGAGGLRASPEGDSGSGLTLETSDSPVEPAEQATPVRLGRVEAWRDSAAGRRRSVRYVIPTASGKLVATCRASARSEPGTLALCERALSTLRLPAAVSLPLAEVVARQRRHQALVTGLSEERARARRSLAEASRPADQRVAAQALASAHTRFAERYASLPGGTDVAAAARRTAAAYEALAAAAGSDQKARWRAAVERVRRAEAALRQALAAA